MRSATKSASGWQFFGIVAVLTGWSVMWPLQLNAQNTCPTPSQGQNAVYNPTCTNNGPVVGSSSFIDASMFAHSGVDFCKVLNGILSSTSTTYPPTGAVIDARGLANSNPPTSLTCSASPWGSSSGYVNVPSTILLPATLTAGATPKPIILSTPWVLPANTHLIGEGDGISGTSFTPGTTIQAASGFSSGSSMFQFGPLTCLPPPGVPSLCSGISVEKLTLDGNGQSVNGITNALGASLTYVDHVSLYRILGTGLSVSGSAVNSGPYTNINFDLGGVSGTSSTVCASINGLTGTKGIHGLKCISENNVSAAAVLLDSSNNSLKDIVITGFHDGILVGSQGPAQSNVLVNITGNTQNCNPICGPPINTVHLEPYTTNGKPNVTDISIIGATNDGPGTVTIADDLTSTNLTNPTVGIYALGESLAGGGYSRFTTSPNAPTWAVGTATPIGSCARGSLYSCNNVNCSAALWACSTPSGQSYGWTAIK
jgi:hypothetical protein